MIELDDLRSDPWITWGQTGSLQSDLHLPADGAINGWFTHSGRGVMNRDRHTLANCDAARACRAGLGVCVILASAAIAASGSAHRCRGLPFAGTSYALWRAQTRAEGQRSYGQAFRTASSVIVKVHHNRGEIEWEAGRKENQ